MCTAPFHEVCSERIAALGIAVVANPLIVFDLANSIVRTKRLAPFSKQVKPDTLWAVSLQDP